MSIAVEGVLTMFESLGEVVVLGLAVMVTWMTAWAVAERRTVHTLASSYEVEVERSSRRIAELELRVTAHPVYSSPPWTDRDTDALVDPAPADHVTAGPPLVAIA